MKLEEHVVGALVRAADAAAADSRIERIASHIRGCGTPHEQAKVLAVALRAAYAVGLPASPHAAEGLYALFGPDADDMAVTAGAICRAIGLPFQVVVSRAGQGLTCWIRAEVEPDVWIDILHPEAPCP